ncbi:MAG: 1-deoxy-D-xylulose-5-phosphate reductoisomerase [Bacilli bacterium]|nr:1-deoxy-D-xylulose-5-phosphate reductoisomerase [Bacilli bacterium]
MGRHLIIYGISGNIGEQALAVLSRHDLYDLVGFSVGHNVKVIPDILKKHPTVKAIYAISDEALTPYKKQYPQIKFYSGQEGLMTLLTETKADMLLNALVGFVGLAPTLQAISLNMDIALANKESLVVGGELVMHALKHSKSTIYPVDSEHSAIYKCLQMAKRKEVSDIILTASGGAFRHLSRADLANVTPAMALKHPTWRMGEKVTIDSASMLNKGFEIIEAYYLFNMSLNHIQVLMHDESYVHSLLRLKDGTYLAEVTPPSMEGPIRYALMRSTLPENVIKAKTINEFGHFHFHDFDPSRYPMVGYAIKAIKMGGIMPCVLNAVDEVAVDLFLKNMISFLDIERIVALALKTFKNKKHPDYEMLVQADHDAREWAKTASLLEGSL